MAAFEDPSMEVAFEVTKSESETKWALRAVFTEPVTYEEFLEAIHTFLRSEDGDPADSVGRH
jgi:hypothetical protein